MTLRLTSVTVRGVKRWTDYDRALLWLLTDWAVIVVVVFVVCAAYGIGTHLTLHDFASL